MKGKGDQAPVSNYPHPYKKNWYTFLSRLIIILSAKLSKHLFRHQSLTIKVTLDSFITLLQVLTCRLWAWKYWEGDRCSSAGSDVPASSLLNMWPKTQSASLIAVYEYPNTVDEGRAEMGRLLLLAFIRWSVFYACIHMSFRSRIWPKCKVPLRHECHYVVCVRGCKKETWGVNQIWEEGWQLRVTRYVSSFLWVSIREVVDFTTAPGTCPLHVHLNT